MKSQFFEGPHLAPGIESIEFGRADLERAYMAALSSDGKIMHQTFIDTDLRMPKVRNEETNGFGIYTGRRRTG